MLTLCGTVPPYSFVSMVTEHAAGTCNEIIDYTMSGDEDRVGERDCAQWKHVSHIRNSDTDQNENISDMPIQSICIL